MTGGNRAWGQSTRRTFLLGTSSALMLAACGDRTTKTTTQGSSLAPFFATGENEPPVLRAGVSQRMPWGIADQEGIPLRDLPSSLPFTVADRDGKSIGPAIEVVRRGDGTPYPFYPLQATLPAAGAFEVATTIGKQRLSHWVVAAADADVPLVQPGERAIPLNTPTVADARGVDPICTRQPACPFHELTLGDALANGKPTAFLISTPAFCQVSVCGPVLELLVEEVPGRPLNVVHAEVYVDAVKTGDPLRAQLTEAVKTYRLTFEPSLLVVDRNGMVTDRFDFVYDRSELRAALDRVAPK